MKKSQRFVADQRFDLPQYNSMINFMAQEFHSYNESFISADNKVIANWVVQDNGGLQIKLNKGSDSVLVNSERDGRESLVVRCTSCDDLTLDLENNSVNYVEVELYSNTTGDDSVAVWDPTANSGEGEEFIQNVDTVNLWATHRLVSNTIAFSVGQTNRIPLAEVTTSGGSITNIQDARDMLFHLEIDWNFGSPRTDLGVRTLKDDLDAIKTSIKEMKELSSFGDAEWYQDTGVGTLSLLERINYILVDGGQIKWDMPKAAEGSMIAHHASPVEGIKDGDTFTISDGVTPITFEFDTDASSPPNPVTIGSGATAAAVKAAMIAAINAAAFDITASPGPDNKISLVNDNTGSAGNVAISENLANNNVTLAPQGMIDGFTNTELTWTDALKIIAPGRAYSFTVSAQTVSNLADGEVVYVTLPDVGTAPGGPLAVSKAASSAYLLNAANTRGYILAYRSGTKVYFGNGWQSMELESGEESQLGDGIPTEWITAMGLVDEYDSTPPYTSSHWITPGASFTQTISELDAIVDMIHAVTMGPRYEEYVVSDGGAGFQIGSKVKLPPAYGVGGNYTYQTGIRQLDMFVDGRKWTFGVGEDVLEDPNIGAGIGDQVELLRAVPNGKRITFKITSGGGQDGKVAVRPGKRVKNGSGALIPANKVCAWADDGTIVLADANVVTLSDFAGITVEPIADGTFGEVAKIGNIAGICSGLGATVGDKVWMDGAVPGGVTLTKPTGGGDTAIMLGYAEPPDGVASPNADDLWLNPEIAVL